MGKKCIPGVLCIENMTLFVLIIILLFSVYVYSKSKPPMLVTRQVQVQVPVPVYINNNSNVLDNPESPPLKNPYRSAEYSQIGILTKNGMILPLMGRRHMNGRDKWQYYTISNSGNLNTKLPVSVKGKSCTSEYGCDEMMNGDAIYVEGYNDTFKATIYENNSFSYIPHL